MKFIAKLILIILFVPLCIILVLTSTVRVQLLNPKFWKDTFKANNVYLNLAKDFKNYAEDQTSKGGGKKSDLKIITDVITPEIIEDFTTHNLDNFLGFANGERKELLVYLPINKIPKEFAPKSVGLNSEEIPFVALLSKFNINFDSSIPLSQIAYFGMSTNYVLIGSASLLIVLLLLLYLLTRGGGRFVAIGSSFLLTGTSLLFLFRFSDIAVGNLSKSVLVTSNMEQVLLVRTLPGLIKATSIAWFYIGIIFIVLGVILFFFKKPSQNN